MASTLKVKVASLASNKDLFDAALKYAKRQKQADYLDFLVEDFSKPIDVARTYLVPGAAKELAVSKSVKTSAAKYLAPRWSEADKALEKARLDIEKMINADSLARFSVTDEFKAYRSKNPKVPEQVVVAHLRKDKNLAELAVAHAKKEFNDENLEFLRDKGTYQHLYTRYIASTAPRQVNIPSPTLAMWTAIVEPDEKKLAELVRKAREEVTTFLDDKVIPGFVTSDEFVAVCVRSGKIGDPKKAAKTLGIKDVDLLTKAAAVRYAGDTKGADKLLKDLAKAERLASPEVLLQALKDSGLA